MASPKFKPRHGGSEHDRASSCFCLALQFSDEAWPLACQPLVAYDNLCIHSPIIYIQATCLPLPSNICPCHLWVSDSTVPLPERATGLHGPLETKSSLSGQSKYRGPGHRHLLVGPGFFTDGGQLLAGGNLSRIGPDLVPEATQSLSSCLKGHLLSSCHYEHGLHFYLCSSHLWLQLVAHLWVSWGRLVSFVISQHRHDRVSVLNSSGLRCPERFLLFSSDC